MVKTVSATKSMGMDILYGSSSYVPLARGTRAHSLRDLLWGSTP